MENNSGRYYFNCVIKVNVITNTTNTHGHCVSRKISKETNSHDMRVVMEYKLPQMSLTVLKMNYIIILKGMGKKEVDT